MVLLVFPDARTELEKLSATHRVVPVPAYNIEGNLIRPEAYQRSLEDAIVELHFNLMHWAIAGKKGTSASDIFVAEIEVIQVLVPPHLSTSSTMKRRVLQMHLDPNALVNKKLQIS